MAVCDAWREARSVHRPGGRRDAALCAISGELQSRHRARQPLFSFRIRASLVQDRRMSLFLMEYYRWEMRRYSLRNLNPFRMGWESLTIVGAWQSLALGNRWRAVPLLPKTK